MHGRSEQAQPSTDPTGQHALTVLMLLTAGAILGWYLLGVLLVYPLIGIVSLPVYLGSAVVVAAAASWGLSKYQLYRVRRGAHQITPETDPRLHEAVASMSDQLEMATPDLYLVEAEEPNARAIGTRWDGAIVFHSGLYELLEDEELDAIAGHELAHLFYCDSLVTVASMHIERFLRRLAWLAATVVNLFVFALVVVVAAITGGESRRQAKWRASLHRLLTRVCVGVAGLVVLIPRNALSRYREFVADRTAARLLGRPEPMVQALKTLDGQPESVDSSPLTPVNVVETRLRLLYATHPSINRRVEALQSTSNPTAPGPTNPGPILGTGTQFGLTVAPVVILSGFAGLIAFRGWLAVPTVSLGRPAVFPVLAVGAVLWIGSLLTFPWAMLFGAGGDPRSGVLAVCSLGGIVTASTIVSAPWAGLLGVASYGLLAGAASHHLVAIARDYRARR